MKRLKILFVFILIFTGAVIYRSIKTAEKEYPYIKIPKDIQEVGEFKNSTFLIKKNGKYGLMRADTTIVVEPMWDSVESFNERGYSRVGKNGKYGVINEHQDIVIPIIYDEIKPTSEKNFIVSKDKKWGVVNWKNNEVIPIKYESITGTKFEKYIIKENGKYGVINIFGNVIIKPKYTGLSQINRKTYIVSTGKGKKYYILGSRNDFTEADIDLSSKYDKILSFCDHVAIVRKEGADFILDLYSYEMKILGYDYNVAGDFVNRMAVVRNRNGKYGIINEDGEVVIEPEYEYLSLEGDGMVLFKEGKNYGYMDIMENIVIPAAFREITPFYKDRAIFKVNGREGVVNIKGKVVILPEYMEVVGIRDNLYILRTEKGVGVFDEKGKTVIEPKYYGITFFGKNNFKIMDKGIVRIINYAGKEILSVKASEIRGEWKDRGQINLKDRIYIFI